MPNTSSVQPFTKFHVHSKPCVGNFGNGTLQNILLTATAK